MPSQPRRIAWQLRLQRRWIQLSRRRWFIPSLCLIPYWAILLSLLARGLGWIAAAMLFPFLLLLLFVLISGWLAWHEFNG